jgi:hypothetical protein
MEDQSKHLENLIQQKNSVSVDISLLENNLKIKKELLLKIQGAIEYLTQIGVSLTPSVKEESDFEETENSET